MLRDVRSVDRKRKTVRSLSAYGWMVRNRRGVSLATIVCMSVLISMYLTALYAGIMPVYNKVATLRFANNLRAANEAAIDYVIDQINNGGIQLSSLSYGSSTSLNASIPNNITQQGSAKPTMSVTITNLGFGNSGQKGQTGQVPTNCVLYDPNRASNYNFMLLTSTAQVGAATKQLTVLLEPIASPAPSYLNGSFGAWGTTAVQLVGLSGVNAYNLPPGWKNPYQFADIGSLGAGNQVGTGNPARGVIQAGSQFEFPATSGQFNAAIQYTMNQFNASSVSQASWAQIMGNIYSNGNDAPANSGYWPRSQSNDMVSNQSYANVFGAANGMSIDIGNQTQGVPSGYQNGTNPSSISIPSWNQSPTSNTSYDNWGNPGTGAPWNGGNTGPLNAANPYTGAYVDSNSGFTAPTVAQAPGAPPGTPNLGAVTVNGTLNITPGAPAPTGPLGTIPAGATVNIPPGDYSVSTLNVNGNITIDPSVNGATNLYVNPPNTNTGNNAPPAVSFSNNSNVNMSGNGNSPAINFNGGNSNMPGFTQTGTQGFGATPNSGNNSSRGTSANQPAVDINHPVTELPNSGSASNLTINTNANCNMVCAGNARALINAPKANVNVGAQQVLAKPANFYGSIIAGVCTIISDFNNGAGAFLHYDLNLKRAANNGSLTFTDPWSFAQQQATANTAVQYRAVSWQER